MSLSAEVAGMLCIPVAVITNLNGRWGLERLPPRLKTLEIKVQKGFFKSQVTSTLVSLLLFIITFI